MPIKLAPIPGAILCSLVALGLSGCDNTAGNQTQTQTPPKVEVMALHSQSIPVTTELPGRTSAFRVAEVRPQVSGLVLKREFTEGSDVEAGQSLYQIDPAPFQAAFDNAHAALAESEANARIAQTTLKRYKSLAGTQYISRQDLDQADATAAQTSANVEAAKAQLNSARINLNWSSINSPIAGRIGRSSVTEGALVQSGQTDALATVQQLDPMYVDVTQSSQDFLRLQQEMASGRIHQNNGKAEVSVIMGDGSVYSHKGTLAFSDVTVDQTTGSITLRAIVPNPEHSLLPGMFVRAKLDEGINPSALLIPQQAVTRTPRGDATTLVVGSDNKVEVRTISVLETEGDKWLVTGGIQSGERVIVSGLQRAQSGEQVDPVPLSEQNSASPKGTAN
ncbi:efflux RND transporter periplasmic adaptor subunit [Pantoea sp. Cy-640]|uniref:efflux RND transporter periplasmic adaptor subunit n=1 Tax=Pantoea sp. Cy-640 TaxID=2608353 RepID=UPI001419126F|nr:efflux RND transporter periplasmic adaptor subunit [Pantoea sp. Cy-640]NIG16170.1 efflux RND transporter periplasmic adaptor subunit [Pantoea sp. Cy-640]